jgi:hypothetical protein
LLITGTYLHPVSLRKPGLRLVGTYLERPACSPRTNEHIRRVTGHASLKQLVDYEHIDEVFAREVEVGLRKDDMD